MSTASPRPTGAARVFRSFTILVIVLYVAYLVRTISDEQHAWEFHLKVGAIFAGSAVVLAWLAKLAWTKVEQPVVRFLLALVLAYHALFGPAMMLDRVAKESVSNDDLVIRVWPHVIHAINSFE